MSVFYLGIRHREHVHHIRRFNASICRTGLDFQIIPFHHVPHLSFTQVFPAHLVLNRLFRQVLQMHVIPNPVVTQHVQIHIRIRVKRTLGHDQVHLGKLDHRHLAEKEIRVSHVIFHEIAQVKPFRIPDIIIIPLVPVIITSKR